MTEKEAILMHLTLYDPTGNPVQFTAFTAALRDARGITKRDPDTGQLAPHFSRENSNSSCRDSANCNECRASSVLGPSSPCQTASAILSLPSWTFRQRKANSSPGLKAQTISFRAIKRSRSSRRLPSLGRSSVGWREPRTEAGPLRHSCEQEASLPHSSVWVGQMLMKAGSPPQEQECCTFSSQAGETNRETSASSQPVGEMLLRS